MAEGLIQKASEIAREVLMRKSNEETMRAAEILLMGHVNGSYPVRIHCECSSYSCIELIEMDKEKVRSAHEETNAFILIPGHVAAHLEKIIEETETYIIARKNDADSVEAVERVVDDDMVLTNKLLEELGSSQHFIRYFNNLSARYRRPVSS